MNYRHAYHAGNFADVVKHVVLCDVIAYLQRKPKPIRIIDTHAGIGAYDLTGPEASKTGEWRAGFGAVCDAVRVGARPVPAPVRAYLEAVSAALEVNSLRGSVQTPSEALSQDPSGKDPSRLSADRYAGSALLAAGLLRGEDRLIANELHAEDRKLLAAHLRPFRGAKVLGEDGYEVLASVLPPKERRGVVLIDPPFEVADEFQRIAAALRDGWRRFRTGIFVVWYPIKDPAPVRRFRRQLADTCEVPSLALEVLLRTPADNGRLNGCGLIVVNPPFGFEARMAPVLTWLSGLFSSEQGAVARFETLRGP